tara:strand:- start:2981 stop:3583 length:603 start_codon:yes stop_codon:yes gene_type:complete
MSNYFYDKLPDDIQNYIYMINKAPLVIQKYLYRNSKIINIKQWILPFIHNNNLFHDFNSWHRYPGSILYIYNNQFINAFVDSYYYDYKFNDVIFWHKFLSVIYKLIFHSEFTNFSNDILIKIQKKNKILNKYTLLFCKKYNFKLSICLRNNSSHINYSIHNIYSNDILLSKPINFYKLLSYIKIYKPYQKKIYDINQLWN